jgi:methionyl-tRNA formyltransferase
LDKINIFFFGISPLGIKLLSRIIKNKNFNIIGVVGKKNKKLHSSDSEKLLIKICDKNQIPIYQDINQLNKIIKKKSLGIIGGYDGIIKKNTIKLFDKGIFNIHFGIIPYTRGCNPTMWSILQNKKKAGYTLYKISNKIDFGKIYDQKIIPIKENDNSFTLFKKLTKLADNNFNKFLNKLNSNKIREIKSPYKKYKNFYFNKILPNDGYYNWNWSNKLIHDFNKCYDFKGYLPGKTNYKNKDIYLIVQKIYKTKKKYNQFQPGHVLEKSFKNLIIKTNDGFLKARLRKNYKFIKKNSILSSIYKNDFSKILKKINRN